MGRVAAGAVLLALGGCHLLSGSCHDPKAYMKAKSLPSLVVPEGLDMADTGNSLKIPRLNEPAPPPRKGKEPCLDEPPPFSTPKKPVPQARSIIPSASPVS
jgi:uncharacterized lipoprotein